MTDATAPTGDVAVARVVALVPARDEADRVGATVAALRAIPAVTEVVVVDDGSTDATASEALAADRKSTRLNSSHVRLSRMPSSA